MELNEAGAERLRTPSSSDSGLDAEVGSTGHLDKPYHSKPVSWRVGISHKPAAHLGIIIVTRLSTLITVPLITYFPRELHIAVPAPSPECNLRHCMSPPDAAHDALAVRWRPCELPAKGLSGEGFGSRRAARAAQNMSAPSADRTSPAAHVLLVTRVTTADVCAATNPCVCLVRLGHGAAHDRGHNRKVDYARLLRAGAAAGPEADAAEPAVPGHGAGGRAVGATRRGRLPGGCHCDPRVLRPRGAAPLSSAFPPEDIVTVKRAHYQLSWWVDWLTKDHAQCRQYGAVACQDWMSLAKWLACSR